MTTNIINTRLNHGIIAGEGNYGADLTVTTQGQVLGPKYGIYQPGFAVAVLNQGAIHGGDVGIDLHYAGTVTNTGSIYGGAAAVVLGYGGTLDNAGTISSGNVNYGAANAAVYLGYYDFNAYGTDHVTNSGLIIGKDIGLDIGLADISNSGRIYGTLSGVALRRGSLLNTGTISGKTLALTMAGGTVNNAGLISSPTLGLFALSGTIMNQTGAEISGNLVGVGLYPTMATALTFTNAGIVNGGAAGVYLTASSLINLGTIENAGIGVYLASGYVENTGLINGTSLGVKIESGTLISSGNISGGTTGIYLYAGALTANGEIAGGSNAIYGKQSIALNLSPSAVLNGAIRDASRNGSLTFEAGQAGMLSGIGVNVTGFNSFNFAANAAWTLEGSTAGLADGQSINGFSYGDALVLSNFVASAQSLVSGALILSNGAATETLGISTAVYDQNFAVTNDGASTSIDFVSITTADLVKTIATHMRYGIDLGAGKFASDVTLAPSGFTTGVYESFSVPQANFSNFGEIYAAFDGLVLSQNATAVNYGRIIAEQPAQLQDSTLINRGFIQAVRVLAPAAGIVLESASSLENSGVILGGDYGVRVLGGSLTNSGFMSGTFFSVEGLNENSSLFNSGTLFSPNIGVSDYGGPLYNSGTIDGLVQGVYLSGRASLTNAGTIAGGTYAVRYASIDPVGTFHLAVLPGADFIGAVDDATGNGELFLEGNSPGSLDIGNTFSGFSAIEFAPGAPWTLEGAASDLASGQSISGFAPGDTLILDNFAAATNTFVPGTGLVLSNGATAETLDFTSLPQNLFLQTSSEAGNTTIGLQPLISIVSSRLNAELTPGSGGYASALTVTSAGALNPPAGTAFYAAASISNAALTNAGTISGLVEFEDAARITNTGTITGAFGLALHDGGNVTDSGSISGIFAAMENAGGILDLTLAPGAAFHGAVIDQAGNGTLTLAGDTPGSIGLGTSFTGFSNIAFANAWTLEGAADDLANGQSISGFSAGDTIILDNFAAASYSLGPRGLTLSNGATTETLGLTGISQFNITDNANGGTDITTDVACFCAGTRIATPLGNIAIENLRIGDLVKTMHGVQPIRWIGRRNYAARFIAGNPAALPIRIRRHAIAFNIPSRDIYVSPDHAIAEGGVLIHAHLLQNGISIHQPERDTDVEYFHLEFDSHTVIFAENISVESFVDEGAGNRFQNRHTRIPPVNPQTPCLPRVFEGFHLQNIRSRIASRAGIAAPDTLGALIGVIDACTPTLIRGWAQNSAAPEHPVTLEIISGLYRQLFLANAFRPDLRAAGLGSGCHGFSLPLPNLASPITLRRAADGATISGVGRKRTA